MTAVAAATATALAGALVITPASAHTSDSTTPTSPGMDGTAAVTAADSGTPGKVRKLTVPSKKITTSTATAKWKAPNDSGDSRIKRYQLRIKKNGSWGSWKSTKPGKLKTGSNGWFAKTWQNLAVDSRHVVKVRAKNAEGTGKATKVSFTTDSSASEPDSGSGDNNPLSPYFITSSLCEGADCEQLPLGDIKLTTTTPAVGKMYACQAGNPSAPGSETSAITWIDFDNNTWDFTNKPWLPAGSAMTGSYGQSVNGGSRTITSTGLPTGGQIGNWPMTQYPLLTAIDANPGVPAAQNHSFTIPASPTPAASPGCLSMGAIAIGTNGVVIYNAVDARGDDAVAHEIVDVYGGHPAQDQYHYHFVSEQLEKDTARLADGHSGIVGYALDGYPLYGYYGSGGVQMTNSDLDVCHGHDHGSLGYHYHATLSYPYTLGCFRGQAIG
ncbi:MAG: YHYH protein [Actinobacteria bacterium]|nr:YHYH protein [Actinomycetota bacterium]